MRTGLPTHDPVDDEHTVQFFPRPEPQPFRVGKGAASELVLPDHQCPGCRGWRVVWLRRAGREWVQPCPSCNANWRDRIARARSCAYDGATGDARPTTEDV